MVLAVCGLVVASVAGGVVAANAYATTGCRLDPRIYANNTISAFQAEVVASANLWGNTQGAISQNSSAGFKVARRNDGATGYDGKAEWQCNATGANRTATAWVNVCYTNSYRSAKRKCVWAHEIGHVLGLNHSAATNALMYYKPTNIYDLGLGCSVNGDDAAGINTVDKEIRR